jgi:hypothetical protein
MYSFILGTSQCVILLAGCNQSSFKAGVTSIPSEPRTVAFAEKKIFFTY